MACTIIGIQKLVPTGRISSRLLAAKMELFQSSSALNKSILVVVMPVGVGQPNCAFTFAGKVSITASMAVVNSIVRVLFMRFGLLISVQFSVNPNTDKGFGANYR